MAKEEVVITQENVIKVLCALRAERTQYEAYKERLKKIAMMGDLTESGKKLILNKMDVIERKLAKARKAADELRDTNPNMSLYYELYYIEATSRQGCMTCIGCGHTTINRLRARLIKHLQENPELLDYMK